MKNIACVGQEDQNRRSQYDLLKTANQHEAQFGLLGPFEVNVLPVYSSTPGISSIGLIYGKEVQHYAQHFIRRVDT